MLSNKHIIKQSIPLITVSIVLVLSMLAVPLSTALAVDRPAVASPGVDGAPEGESYPGEHPGYLGSQLDAFSAAAAFEAGADRLEALQNNDGGWDWPLDDGNPASVSPKNTIGPIAMGLAQAYYNTGDPAHLASMFDAGGLLLAKTNNFSPSDGYLAAELDRYFGGTTYTDHVLTNFYGPLAAGTYNRNGAGTLYSTTSYVALIRTARAGLGNLAEWDLGMGAVGAVAAGSSDITPWLDGIEAELDEHDSAGDYDVLGLAGAVYGLSYAGVDYDTTAGDLIAASNLADLAMILAGYQIAGGGFSYTSQDLTLGNETNQETAYAILALSQINRDSYISAIQGAGSYLLSVQLLTGGWDNYPGDPDGENNELTGEALWALRIAFPENWVNGSTGSDTNDGSLANPFATIQKGVDEILSYGIVHAAAGTYVEQVEITKALTLEGVGPTTVIESPATLTKFFTTSTTNKPIVFIHDTTDVTVRNLTVDGAGKGNLNYRFSGIAFWNAGGAVDTVQVLDIRDTPFSGAQHGVAIYAWNDDLVTRTINVWDSTITGFQKTGMALNTADNTPLVVDVRGNTVTGYGTTTITAQNGIQVWSDLGSGTVDDNTVTNLAYDNSSWVATSILNYYADLDVTNNIVTGSHLGLYNIAGQGTISGNDFALIKAGGYAGGIIATDPPAAVPSPFDGPTSGDRPTGDAPGAVLTVAVLGNTLTFSGVDNAGTYAIEAYAGYGPDDIAFTANGNTITGFEYGLGLYQLTYDPSVFTSMTANDNCLFDNIFGMNSNVDYLSVNGENNYWDDATGPYHPTLNPTGLGDEVSDYVDFAPWLDSCGGASTGNWHNVTQDTYHATLQDAVDSSAMGDVVEPVSSGLGGGATITTPNVTIDLNGMTAGPGSPFLYVSAANVSVVGPGVLAGNMTDPAIVINPGGDNFTLENVEVREWADAVEVNGNVTSINIIGNFIHSNGNSGLLVNTGLTIGGVQDIYGNLFKLNGGNGVQNNGAGTVDATYNSWGDLDGPFGLDSSYGGDGVSANVSYDPWTYVEYYLDMAPPADATQVTVTEGQPFDVAIKADAENVNGVIVRFTYDATMLTVNSLNFDAPWSDPNTICIDSSVPGIVEIQCNLVFPTSQWDADGGTIATVNFTAMGPGLTGNGPWQDLFDVDHLAADSVALAGARIYVNNAGYLAPSALVLDITDADDGQVDILGAAQFTGFVNLEGRGNDSGAVVSVYDPGLNLVADAASASSGAYTTANLLPDYLSVGTTYYLYADAPLFLPTHVAITTTLETHALDTRPYTVLNNVLLLGGDANNTNQIGVGDLSCIGAALGSSSTCGGAGNADVNADGSVNFADIALAAGNYGLNESPWTP